MGKKDKNSLKRNVFMENAIMQYIMTFAQVMFPFLTFPYITRVLGSDYYGIMTFIAATIVYYQLFIEFGFDLYATKQIAEKQHDYEFVGKVLGLVTQAKMILFALAIVIYSLMIPFISIMRQNLFLSYAYIANVFLTIFLPDYLFRGIEKMKIITVRFIFARIISTVLIFVLVKKPEDILFIPLIEILGSLLAIFLTWYQIKQLKITMRLSPLREVFGAIKESSVYFVSTFATTAFGATNTFLLGVMSLSPSEIAYWGVSNKLISSAQSLYTPIVNSLYPRVAADRDFNLPKKTLKIFMPLIVVTSVIVFFLAEPIIVLLGGQEYVGAVPIFRALIPVLVFSFPVLIIGFPVLGNLGKVKETTLSTVVTACFHTVCLVLLIVFKQFNVIAVALLRSTTELVLLTYRLTILLGVKNKTGESTEG